MRTFGSYVNGSTPTVLLVHGAFADASSWSEVIPLLQDNGIDVLAPANPLRGIAADGACLASLVAAIDGPVLLVGHCYGGAVITQAAAALDNVVGLVYVAGFALAEGESMLTITARFPDTLLGPALRPTGRGELCLAAGHYRAAFAADLPDRVALVAAATQRPITAAAFEERCTDAAWRRLPSWFVIAAADQALHPEAQRYLARRIGADTIEVDASHAITRSRPAEVAALVRTAARATRADSH
jgi:pimeloyl-ACP methyl ester carboxylesterase